MANYLHIDKAFEFLTKKFEASSSFSIQDLTNYTEWKDSSSTISKKLRLVLGKEGKNFLVKSHFQNLTKKEFRELCSQNNEKLASITNKLKSLNKTFSEKLIDKAIAAAMSSIEIYNKPDFKYREEIFSLLMVNAWELLLKARIIKNNNEDIESIYRKNKSTGKFDVRDGVYITKDIKDCLSQIDDEVCKRNLKDLIKIRNGSAHFISDYPNLKHDLHKLTCACLENFFVAAKKWFDIKLEAYNFYVIPLTFSYQEENRNLILDKLTHNLWSSIKANSLSVNNTVTSEFSYGLSLEYNRKKADLSFNITDEINAQNIKISGDDFQEIYNWDHSALLKKLKERYSDFKQDNKFNSLKKQIKDDKKYCHIRRVDPKNLNSYSKIFYKPDSVIKFFDNHYQKLSK